MVEGTLAFIGIVYLFVIASLMLEITIKKTRRIVKNLDEKLVFVGFIAAFSYILLKNFGAIYLQYVMYFVFASLIFVIFLLYLKKKTLKG